MLATRRLRLLGSIALSLLLFAGMPALAFAAEPPVDPATSNPGISGIVSDRGGTHAVLAGISVTFEDAGTHVITGPTPTNGSGFYSMTLPGSSSYIVHFSDPSATYLGGTYDTGKTGNIDLAGGSAMPVPVGDHGVTPNINVEMSAGVHLTGTVTGPGTPPNPLSGIGVTAHNSVLFIFLQTTTATDGTFSLLVAANATYDVSFDGQDLYTSSCAAVGVLPNADSGGGCPTLDVGATDATTDAQMVLTEGDLLTITPDGATVAAGSSETYTATLANPNAKLKAVPAKPSTSHPDPNVTAGTTFSMVGGTCTGAVCTPTAQGDHAVSGTYGSATSSVTLHATAAPATPTPVPTAAPTAAPTAPPTSTDAPGSGEGTPLMALFLMALTGAAVTLFTARRPLRRRS